MTFSLLLIAGLGGALLLTPRLARRIELSRAKHRSLTGHVRMARRIARLVPAYAFDRTRIFGADHAPPPIVESRGRAVERLAAHFARTRPRSAAIMQRLGERVADVEFVGRYRVPFPFSRFVREQLRPAVLVERSRDVHLEDIDVNEWLDLGGAYGVNVFGYEFYKDCLREAAETAGDLGPALGPYHPVIDEVVERLRCISGLEQVSFHMSGTEAVMQAVRMARYHTGRSHLVRFCGSYHGWWDEVQPGIGNPGRVGAVYTLADQSDATLRVLARRRDIACVLVNPLQALHPNASAPGDGALVAGRRSPAVDRAAYASWLKRLREVCTANGIVLIFDEVFVGFRLAPGGAQQWFGVPADLVVYGKTLGGGLPVGVVCGNAALMRRFREDRPLDICFARGTFNAHPWTLAAMNAFLSRLESTTVQTLYSNLDTTWARRSARFNQALAKAGLPLAVEHLSSIFTVNHLLPSRYNWMLQYYLNAEGLLLPWVGTGRLIFSLNYGDQDFEEVTVRFVQAAEQMAADGWWWHPEGATDRSVRRSISRELLKARFQRASASSHSPVTIGS